MELQKTIFNIEQGIATIKMDYPKNLNAIDEQMADELLYLLKKCEEEEEIAVVVIEGGEKAFSAGGDIGYFYEKLKEAKDINMDSLISKAGLVSLGIRALSKLVITSVSGAAAGAGANLALSGDFVIATNKAKFIQAFVNIGLVPDTGGSYILSKALGPHRAMELCATGRAMEAKEAKELGLVYEVVAVEDLSSCTKKLAEKLANGPRVAYRNIKKQIFQANYLDYERYLAECEVPTQRECISSEDFREGIMAFVEKRKPQFKGK